MPNKINDEVGNMTDFMKAIFYFIKYQKKEFDEDMPHDGKALIVFAMDGEQMHYSILGREGDIVNCISSAVSDNDKVRELIMRIYVEAIKKSVMKTLESDEDL
jgi:hypothetical protein